MASIFCRQCGAEIVIDPKEEKALCPACGAENRIPSSITRTEQKYQMANRHRMRKNFDAARGYYENILEEDPEELEACFGILLCKYGVEYENEDGEDHAVRCHRIVEAAVTSDIYYKTLAAYADAESMAYYRAEAEKIQKAQQELLKFAKREARYDVYLCYKEQGVAEGDPTDKENIQELISFLQELGLRVFCDREKMEKEHPQKSDAYLLAAQYTAPVMVVYGTKKSFFTHESVMREWSSYRALMTEKNSSRKMVVACREAFMYSLPEALLDLPKINIDKLEFYDLLKEEIFKGRPGFGKKAVKNDALENLYTRAQFCMEDGNFEEADGYFVRILEKHPEEGRAYWGRMLCECRCLNGEQLKQRGQRIDEMPSYRFAIRYALDQDKPYYEGIAESILEKIQEKEKKQQEEQLRIQEAAQQEKIKREKEKLELEIKEKERRKKRAAKKRAAIGVCALAAIVAVAGGAVWYSQEGQYRAEVKKAVSYMDQGNFEEAQELFEEQIKEGRIGEEYLDELYYRWGKSYIDEGSYSGGAALLIKSNGYEDADTILDGLVADAKNYYDEGDLRNALYYFDFLSDYAPEMSDMRKEILSAYRDWLCVYGDHAVIKKADGTAMMYGPGIDASAVSSWTNLDGVYCSETAVFGWTEDGRVYAGGSQQTENFSDWTNIVQVVGNSQTVLGLTSEGTVVVKGVGDASYISALTDVKRLCMSLSGCVGVVQNDGTLHYYSSGLGMETGTAGTVADANYAGEVLVLVHNDGWLEQIGGSARLESSSEEPLYISQSYELVTFISTTSGAGGSFCGANHFWYNLNRQITGNILNIGSGYTDIYDESQGEYEIMNMCTTVDGDVMVHYCIHSKNEMGVTLTDFQKILVTNIYE